MMIRIAEISVHALGLTTVALILIAVARALFLA
jgi:hypothetical protein